MEKLGIEPIQLLTQTFNFLVLVFILGKFLYKPILKKLEERRKKIEEGLQYTEKMKKALEENEKKRQEIINKAKDEARTIVEEGKKTGKKVEAEIIEKAHKEAKEIVERGGKELELERQQMEKQLKTDTIEIAEAFTMKILSEVLDKDNQEKIIDKKIKQFASLVGKVK